MFRHAIARLQNRKWKRKQQQLLKSPFYQSLSGQPLEVFPVMNKASFMAHFDEINTVNIALDQAMEVAVRAEQTRDFSPEIDGITIGLSSGTSGNRGIFLASEAERAQWVATVLDRVIGLTFRQRTVAFFLRANSNLYSSVQSKLIHFEFFDLLADLGEHIERLNRLQPHIIVAQPSLLLELAARVQARKLVVNPDKIISVAEVLYPEDRKRLEHVFGQTIHQVYQCTEGFLAASCKYGTLHFNEDLIRIEKKYVDRATGRFHPVITDLERKSQPIIRYELNDIVVAKESCKCGSPFLAIDQIEGRSDDRLTFFNNAHEPVSIFPDFFRRAIVLSSGAIDDYILIQQDADTLHLFVNGNEDSYTAAKKSLLQLLSKKGISGIEIKPLRQKPPLSGNKLRRIRNDQGTTR